MTRIINAFKMFWMGLSIDPKTFNPSMLRFVAGIFPILLDVANDHRPRIFKVAGLCIESPKDKEEKYISVWVANGAAMTPFERINELKKENQALLKQISEMAYEKEEQS